MAGRGRAPKNPDERIRRNADPEFEALAEPDELHGPELDGEHAAETLAWWDTWRRSPMAAKFTDVAWSRLAKLARLVDILANPETSDTAYLRAVAELRLQEASFGATPVDLQRLRWTVGRADDSPVAPAAASAATARAKKARRTDPRLKVVPPTK